MLDFKPGITEFFATCGQWKHVEHIIDSNTECKQATPERNKTQHGAFKFLKELPKKLLNQPQHDVNFKFNNNEEELLCIIITATKLLLERIYIVSLYSIM